MNVMKFAQELSSLVIRYTKQSLPDSSSDSKLPEYVPLTKQEVINVANNVFATLLGISDINANNTSFKTSSTEIVVSTPTTPVADNINPSENDENTRRSQGIQETPKNTGTSNPDLRSGRIEKNALEIFQDGKKFISRSSPAICINNIKRSDTFVFDNQSTETTADSKIYNDVFGTVEKVSAVLKSLNEARMSARNIIAKLDAIEKQAFLSSLDTRQLSTTDTNSSQTSSVTRLIIPAKMSRSISDFLKTPTSSKSSTPGSQNSLNKRKSSGATPVNTTSRKVNMIPVTRSTSNLNMSLNKPSNKLSDPINPRPTKNPKYAHIQSTIPKPISGKR